MFQKMQHSIGEYLLKKKQPIKQLKKLCNLKHAKSVGILFCLTNKDDWEVLWHIYSELISQQKNVTMLGFYNGKEVPNWLPKTSFPILTKKDLDFWLLPKKNSIAAFCSKKFDILIDFSANTDIQNLYIVNDSQASLKVGTHTENGLQYYDLVIQKPLNVSFEAHTKNLLYYLTTLNTSNNEN